MTPESWPDVARIYQLGIATGYATFEKQVPDLDSWDRSHRKDCRFVAKVDGKTAGWAALSNVSGRSVYAGVAEVSVYIDEDFRGMGIGSKLLEILVAG